MYACVLEVPVLDDEPTQIFLDELNIEGILQHELLKAHDYRNIRSESCHVGHEIGYDIVHHNNGEGFRPQATAQRVRWSNPWPMFWVSEVATGVDEPRPVIPTPKVQVSLRKHTIRSLEGRNVGRERRGAKHREENKGKQYAPDRKKTPRACRGRKGGGEARIIVLRLGDARAEMGCQETGAEVGGGTLPRRDERTYYTTAHEACELLQAGRKQVLCT